MDVISIPLMTLTTVYACRVSEDHLERLAILESKDLW